jgi:hypothetical protein
MSDVQPALRQQIAEAIHATGEDCLYDDVLGPCDGPDNHLGAADAVLAVLNLTEEWGMMRRGHMVEDQEVTAYDNREAAEFAADAADGTLMVALTGPWKPATP